ncbi:hypothetical protein QBC34DRAFT_425769 [Podospora aff. communis PSN243]|uniref:Uncharacterized protein n=1 Tax=Podospora aff. communis PSN243 TaxID=3040156 RepID=A0AAV9GLX3_9PEZI|nr:hypothetical protein QBC34DRAFT_425769 [Podospora aff. communis PSN243]
MQLASLPSLLCLAICLGPVAGAPAATSEEKCQPRTLCVDGINTCGVPPTIPTFTTTSASTSFVTHTLIPPTTRPLHSTPSCPDGREGSGYTVCWDGINDCGQMYGGPSEFSSADMYEQMLCGLQALAHVLKATLPHHPDTNSQANSGAHLKPSNLLRIEIVSTKTGNPQQGTANRPPDVAGDRKGGQLV